MLPLIATLPVPFSLALAPLALAPLALAPGEPAVHDPLARPAELHRPLEASLPASTPHAVASAALGHAGVVGAAISTDEAIARASVATYVNDCTSGTVANMAGFNDELVDWGVKSSGATGIVNGFTFGYATDTMDVSVGGPGASFDIAFYSGTTGFGNLGTEVARFALTGLPGTTTGAPIVAFVTVDLTTGGDFVLPDGPIGYGYCLGDPGSVSSLAGPMLVDTTACSPGTVSNLDVYACPANPGNYSLTSNLGGTNGSTYMVLTEEDGSEVATTALYNGSGLNPLLASDGGTPPVIGSTWPVTIDNSAGYTTSIGLYTAGSLPPGVVLAGGEVLVDILDPNGFALVSNVIGTGINDHSEFIAPSASLVGAEFTFQGLLFGGIVPYQLTNALEIQIGF